MKNLLLIIFLAVHPGPVLQACPLTEFTSQAWVREVTSDGKTNTETLLIAGNYFSWTSAASDDGAFNFTKGGSWQKYADKVTITYEFNTSDSSSVGSTEIWSVTTSEHNLTLNAGGTVSSWVKSSATSQTALEGAFLFAGRKGNEQTITRRDTNQPRKTLKLLAGGHFQWIAYNIETKQFFGTGGGHYSAVDGKYTETIRFFSRDNKRVGAVLNFDYKVMDGEWHHSGKSSTGEPMYEVWAPRE